MNTAQYAQFLWSRHATTTMSAAGDHDAPASAAGTRHSPRFRSAPSHGENWWSSASVWPPRTSARHVELLMAPRNRANAELREARCWELTQLAAPQDRVGRCRRPVPSMERDHSMNQAPYAAALQRSVLVTFPSGLFMVAVSVTLPAASTASLRSGRSCTSLRAPLCQEPWAANAGGVVTAEPVQGCTGR